MDSTPLMQLRQALTRVRNPRTGGDIVGEGLVVDLSLSPQGVAKATLSSGDPGILEAAKAAAESVAGVVRAVIVSTKSAPAGVATAGGHANPFGLARKPGIATAAESLSDVAHVIAVASGKGGVGKSTLAANLAVALARRGLRIGLLDADIYGPSLPTLFGLKDQPKMRDGKIIPETAFGVKAMSIGLLVDETKALAWRGPMVMGAIKQLIGDVDWGALDILVIDTPPGTGDAHLSLIQSKRLTGAVIVSTPQEMALADARRGIELFRQTGVPILGVVENMAWLEVAGERQYLFGRGGAERAAAAAGAPFLGALPIWPDLREASDAGVPLAASAPESAAATAFAQLAEKLALVLFPR
ncbi:MAG: Mrp/NBP35 family ATP-binding protein [Parvularculaceae bacterium]